MRAQNLLAVAKFISAVTLYDSMFCCVSVEGTCVIVISQNSRSCINKTYLFSITAGPVAQGLTGIKYAHTYKHHTHA